MYKGGWIGRFVLRDTRNDSLLVGLKVTNHVAAHREILCKSALREAAEVTGSSTTIKRLVSSANRRICEPISSTMSLMYTKNNNGPRMDPCGTPALMYTQSDDAPGNTTRCRLSER